MSRSPPPTCRHDTRRGRFEPDPNEIVQAVYARIDVGDVLDVFMGSG